MCPEHEQNSGAGFNAEFAAICRILVQPVALDKTVAP
jgi:hypothetical protein